MFLSVITAHVAYASTVKSKSSESRRNFFFFLFFLFFFFFFFFFPIRGGRELGRYVVSTVLVLLPTFRASLSGTFLPTLPDLVTPLKGHSLERVSTRVVVVYSGGGSGATQLSTYALSGDGRV